MSKENLITFKGKIIEALPNAMFKVKLENGHTILAHISGKMRRFKIWVGVGHDVEVEMTPYDLTKGRIVKREANQQNKPTA